MGDTQGAEAASFDASDWRTVEVPHDWSIEGKIDAKNPTGGSGGYFPSGIAWYRRTFTAPTAWNGKRVLVEFEGVYMNATVYINGHALEMHPYGYTSFTHDLTATREGGRERAGRADRSPAADDFPLVLRRGHLPARLDARHRTGTRGPLGRWHLHAGSERRAGQSGSQYEDSSMSPARPPH